MCAFRSSNRKTAIIGFDIGRELQDILFRFATLVPDLNPISLDYDFGKDISLRNLLKSQ